MNKSRNKEAENRKLPAGSNFPIVGIGASAGGFEALDQFFSNTPNKTGIAFVVIQHLDPDHAGFLPELLQRTTGMPVIQARDRLKIKPNNVYVIPPKKTLSVFNGTLHVFDPVESRGLRLPIDIFFRSLADDRREHSIGIVLSGMGSDGSQGLKAIKDRKGLTIIQDPASAKFDGMPMSALETVKADIQSPAGDLPEKLIACLKYPPLPDQDDESRDFPRANMDKILLLLRTHTGHDFSMYKKNTLYRRIERRINVHQLPNIKQYVRFLQERPGEIEILFKELLIGITGFFRDPAVWDKLRRKILPEMIQGLPDDYILRAWVPACSTGEEAYSLAMVLVEALASVKKNKQINIQIFASDIDQDAIEKARKGMFPKETVADLSPDRLNRFFISEKDGYRVNASIREMVVFASHNVTKDPPFTKLDIISCRNLLIYMEHELQRKLLALFEYSLNANGILVLGTAESNGNETTGYRALDNKLKIFRRNSVTVPNELMAFPSAYHHSKAMQTGKESPMKTVDNIQSATEHILLQRFMPASVLLNEKGDIIFITGKTGKYLEPVAGKANLNIYAMAREGLRDPLQRALRKTMTTNEPVILKNIRIVSDRGYQYTEVTVQRLESPASVNGMILVVFRDNTELSDQSGKSQTEKKRRLTSYQKQLEDELKRSFQELKDTREEMQSSQEEMKSLNEELLSTNEELQSNNEELTTAKEEMQSLNEELQTVNAELQAKVQDFSRTNDDMKNLLNSTEIATLFLDKDQNIRRFTERTTRIIKLRTRDIGRPLSELVTTLKYSEINRHVKKVIKTLIPIETSIKTLDNHWFKVRIMPYRTLDDKIDGVVITFTEITEQIQTESTLRKAAEILKKNKLLQELKRQD